MNPGRTVQALGFLLLLIVTSMGVQAQQQRVEVQLSSHRISVDESVVLYVRAYGIDAEVNTSALDKDFDVTGRTSSRQVNIVNGRRTSIVEWELELAPLTLLVEPPPTGSARDLFLEASVDNNDPYVQAQVIYTLRVFLDIQLLQGSLDVPEVDGILMEQITDAQVYQETVQNRTYQVREFRYSVFPQQSGVLTIPSIVLHAAVAADPNQVPNTRTPTRRIRQASNEVELNVKARPDNMAGSWWLPAKEVTLHSEWSSPVDALVVDQPVTRTIYMTATGVGEEQLPELTESTANNISIYADKPTAATNVSETGLISQQTNTWAVIPQAAGELVLPASNGSGATPGTPAADQSAPTTNADNTNATADIAKEDALASNNDTDALAESVTEETIPITTSANEQGDSELPASVSSALNASALQAVGRWRTIAAVLLAGWVASLLGLWLWMRKRQSASSGPAGAKPEQSESSIVRFQRRAGSRAALDPIKVACDSKDASKISVEVLSWAAMVWPEQAPTHISTVAKRLKSPELLQAFDAIDAQQYRPAGGVKSVAVDQIPALIKQAVDQYHEAEHDTADTNALPSL